ncbi:hypothetical protein BDW75DRAFT_250536 [Aspergillus navahoensis]
MVANLPRELLFLIAEHLRQDGGSLLPYAQVCRDWQSAFECFTFSKVTVHSDEVDGVKAREQKGFSLENFRRATSGQNSTRQPWIREIQYDILVPYELLDWSLIKEDGYTINNPLLGPETPISIQIGLLGCKQGIELEPDTWDYAPEAGTYRLDFRDGQTQAVPPYRARLSSPDALSLVPCVDKLTFANVRHPLDPRPRNRWHQIWAGTVFQIAQRCPTITELYLNLNEYVRPDHLEYIRERRAAVAEGVKNLPTSLRSLNYIGYKEEPLKPMMSALNVLTSDVDALAISLRDLTPILRELRLTLVSLPMDFMCPLDNDGRSTANTTPHWPNLEQLILDKAPPFLPEGQWLALPNAEEQARIDEVSDWEDEICNYERGFIRHTVLDTEQFHRLFISWGLIARHAPKIKLMEYHLNHRVNLGFQFRAGEDVTLCWDPPSSYLSDHRVASAWGFDLNDLTRNESGSISITLPCWPPFA